MFTQPGVTFSYEHFYMNVKNVFTVFAHLHTFTFYVTEYSENLLFYNEIKMSVCTKKGWLLRWWQFYLRIEFPEVGMAKPKRSSSFTVHVRSQ